MWIQLEDTQILQKVRSIKLKQIFKIENESTTSTINFNLQNLKGNKTKSHTPSQCIIFTNLNGIVAVSKSKNTRSSIAKTEFSK